MAWRDWGDDDELLADIADAVRPEPLEPHVVAAGRRVHAWHSGDVDKALAALLYDSHLDAVGGLRGPASSAPRSLVFALGDLRVEIEVSEAGIEGQLIPPGPGRVWLLDAAGPVTDTVADEVGCFSFPAPRHGPIRIECLVSDRRIATEWISI